jgi:hypothetical protein
VLVCGYEGILAGQSGLAGSGWRLWRMQGLLICHRQGVHVRVQRKERKAWRLFRMECKDELSQVLDGCEWKKHATLGEQGGGRNDLSGRETQG